MPLRIRWKSDEYLPVGLMMLGACGLFQLIFIFIAQYFLSIGNYLVVILIPIGITVALFYASKLVFESFAQVVRRKKLKSQFQKAKDVNTRMKSFLNFPITKPLFIVFGSFVGIYIASYVICILIFDSIMSFLLSENISAIFCLFLANFLEKNYAKIRKF